MHPHLDRLQSLTRRHFLRDGSLGLGAVALSMLETEKAEAAPVVNPLATKAPHYKAKAKRVIYLHLTGSPPHLDLYDYKPELVKRNGQPCPDQFVKGKTFAFTSGTPKLLGTPRKFARYGKQGIWLSDALPNLQGVADDLCVIKSMHTDQFNHAPAELLIYTGSPRPGRPSMGSWITYGLGSENENLPGFVVLISSGVQPNGGKNSFGSGFLPSVYQGVQCRSKGDPVLYSSDPPGMDRSLRRASLDALRDLNEIQAHEMGHPETLTRIAQYELAFRMQTSVPEVMDLKREPARVLEAYGAAAWSIELRQQLLAGATVDRERRSLRPTLRLGLGLPRHESRRSARRRPDEKIASMDKPVAALIKDLKQRGLLEDTLIICGGEFGRTPFREGRTAASKLLGRDHFPDCFTMWLAGAGVKGGYEYGASDELGFSVAHDKVHVHDLQATILHLLGFDHKKLIYRFQGRDYRLTDVEGRVVEGILS